MKFLAIVSNHSYASCLTSALAGFRQLLYGVLEKRRRFDVRITQRRSWHGGVSGFLDERLPKGACDGAVCVPVVNFSLTGRLVGGISGLGAERFGYGNYFAITFLLSLPAYMLLPWVKTWIQEKSAG